MPPPAVVEQQAKLGVSAEDSKAQRLKRQQARFRDRGGAFVPSQSNPLVDILLARTVSGESPSKACPRGVTKRVSPVKRGAGAVAEDSLPVPGTSKRKPAASRRRKTKDAEPEAGTETKPAPKRRGKAAKGKKKALDPDTEEPLTKLKATPKGKGKQAAVVPPTSDGNPKTKRKPTTKAKSNPTKEVVEVLDSDDDQTLVDVPHKAKSKPKRSTRREDEDETDDDVPIVRKRAAPHGDNLKPSGSKTTTRVKSEKIPNTGNSGKKASEDGEEGLQNVKYSKANAKKRSVPHDDDEGADASPPKKGKVVKSTSAKPKSDVESEPELAPRTTKVVKSGGAKATGKAKRKGKAEPDYEATKDEDDEPERITKPKKRKKEEVNYDDRPRKAVKFSESGPSHPSSQRLKENQNQSDKNHKRVSKSNSGVKAEHKHEPDDDNDDDAPRLKLAARVPPRDKMSKGPKGPPREVLERIKASAARYLPCADSEPDELDCLS